MPVCATLCAGINNPCRAVRTGRNGIFHGASPVRCARLVMRPRSTCMPAATSTSTSAPAARATTCEQWDVYEVALRGPASGNPFVDVQLAARFTNGARTLDVSGFYDGDGVYRLRFMPPA